MGREKKAKQARREALRRSITTWEIMRATYWDFTDRRRSARGKRPKRRRLSRLEKRRLRVARSLILPMFSLPFADRLEI